MPSSPSALQVELHFLEQLTIAREATLIPAAELLRRQQARRTFHSMLLDPTATAEAVATFTQENADTNFSSYSSPLSAGGLAVDDVVRIRNFCSNAQLHFPRTEYADTVYLLVQSFESVYLNAHAPIWHSTFIVATDLEYRPHASIQKLDEDFYSIVFGRYLLSDLAMVAFTFYEILTEFRSHGSAPDGFSEAVESVGFIKTFNESYHRRQFPYVLASLALGEQYRYTFKFSGPLFAQQPARYIVFYHLMICFLVAHEIAHLINGDLEEKEPFFAWALATIFDHDNDICMLKHIPASELKSFWKKYGPAHSREAGADFEAYRITQDIAVDRMSHRVTGVVAATLVLSVISWIDRARGLMHEGPVALYAVPRLRGFARRYCGSARGRELGPYGRRCGVGYRMQHAASGVD